MDLMEDSDSHGNWDDSSDDESLRKSRKVTLERITLADNGLRLGKIPIIVSCLDVPSRR